MIAETRYARKTQRMWGCMFIGTGSGLTMALPGHWHTIIGWPIVLAGFLLVERAP